MVEMMGVEPIIVSPQVYSNRLKVLILGHFSIKGSTGVRHRKYKSHIKCHILNFYIQA